MKLRILSEIAVNTTIASGVELVFREFYVNKAMNAQFGVDSMFNEELCKTIVLKSVYSYQLEQTPTFELMFGLVKAELEYQGLIVELIPKVYDNLKPTHDPYKNPHAHIYYQCGCGAIFDPGTKRFAELNHKASEAGWKIRWNKDGSGYKPYCVDCGKDVE